MFDTIAEIRYFAGNFPPRGWMFCQGQLLSIAQYTAVFALLGTTYGGNGQTTFALPDFRGRIGVGTGSGPGLSPVNLGEMAGSDSVTLLSTNLPMHNHVATTPAASTATTATPASNRAPAPATLGAATSKNFGAANANIAAPTLAPAGGNQPHNNQQPYLGLSFIICLEGVFPSRN